MADIISIIIFFVVFRIIIGILKAIFGAEDNNDWRRDR